MALDGTYDGLKASVADFLNREDLTAVIPDFIAMAEPAISARLLADGPVRKMMGREQLTVDDEYIDVPDDFDGVRSLKLTGGTYQPLEFIEPEKLDERKSLFPQQGGDPTHYSIVGDELQFWPWNGGTYTGELKYWRSIPALSASAPSNWLLTKHPGVYLHAALLQAAPYLAEDTRIATWGTLLSNAISDLVTADKVARFAPQMGLPQHVYGAP